MKSEKSAVIRELLIVAFLLLVGTAAAQQPKVRPYVGLHASGDAEMFYLGPSLQLGADYRFSRFVGLSAYGHAFVRRIDRDFGNYEFERGKFDCLTAALLLELHPLGNVERGPFVGAGIAGQYLRDRYVSDSQYIYERRYDVLPAIRFGYAFPLKGHKLTAEINATGPYSERTAYGSSTELITQLSLGTRFVW